MMMLTTTMVMERIHMILQDSSSCTGTARPVLSPELPAPVSPPCIRCQLPAERDSRPRPRRRGVLARAAAQVRRRLRLPPRKPRSLPIAPHILFGSVSCPHLMPSYHPFPLRYPVPSLPPVPCLSLTPEPPLPRYTEADT